MYRPCILNDFKKKVFLYTIYIIIRIFYMLNIIHSSVKKTMCFIINNRQINMQVSKNFIEFLSLYHFFIGISMVHMFLWAILHFMIQLS